MHKPSLLEARQLSCIRGDRPLFSDVSLRISSGEGLHIRGENGVGKTSLLRLLVGLAKPEVGSVLWNNQTISEDRVSFHQSLLYMGHRDGLKEELTAVENLQMYAALDGKSLPIENALLALQRFGLRGRETLPVHYLSAGQKRRVLMARMLTRQAKLWILDEPFNALDVKAIAQLGQLMTEHLASGGLLVFTSHQEIGTPNVRVLDL
jgi:heme exporter protein A